MYIRIADNLGEYPQVKWIEPRLIKGFFWNRRRDQAAYCGVQYWPNRDLYRFEPWNSNFGAPLDVVHGFGVATYDELYLSGAEKIPTQREVTYRDPLILYAQLSMPVDGQAILPLTRTSAPKAEVMALHGVLTEVFIIRREALLKASHEVGLRREEQQVQEKRREQIGAPVAVSAGHFLPLRALPYVDAEAARNAVREATPGEVWNVPEPYVTGARSGQIGSVSFADLVLRKGRLLQVGKIIHVHGPATRNKVMADMIEFTLCGESGYGQAYRPRAELKDVRVLSGADITIPPDYLPFPDVVIDGATRVLCAEFTDGALLPMTQSVPGLALDFEKVRATLLDLARAGGHNPDGSRRNIKL